MNRYIVRMCDGKLFALYYSDDEKIYLREYQGKKWGKVKTVVENVREKFTVNISDKGDMILLCQGILGDIHMCKKVNDEFENKIILRNNAQRSPDIVFNAIIKGDCMRLFYNLPIENESAQYISTQEVRGDARWTMAENIDKFRAFEYDMFQIYNCVNEPIVVYQRSEPEMQLGYRKILSGRIGEFKKIFSTGYTIKSHSVLCCENQLHFAVIVQGKFVSKLVYICADKNGVPIPVTIWEGCGIKDVLLQNIDGNIYLQWRINRQVYYAVKKYNTERFMMVEKYHGKMAENIAKARYISCMPIDGIECEEVFVDANKPYEIQGLKTFVENIYPSTEESANEAVNMEYEAEVANLRRSVDILKNKLDVAQETIENKELKIMSLVDALKRKNEEMLKNERSLRAKYKNLLSKVEGENCADESESD